MRVILHVPKGVPIYFDYEEMLNGALLERKWHVY